MSVLDLDTIAELQLVLEDELHLIAAQFAQQLHEQLALLTQYSQQGDWEQLKRTAHFIKGSAANLGASGLATAAAALEQAAKRADDTQLQSLLTQIPAVAAATLTELQAHGINLTLPAQ